MLTRARTRWDVAVAAVGALLIVGPFFRGTALLGLDVTVLPDLRAPESVWGLGTSVPRRGLWLLPASWLGEVVGGSRAIAVLLTLALTCACVGIIRLCGDAPRVCCIGAGVLYAFGPFVFTRIGVGHLSLVFAMAVLPWTLPSLLHPSDDPRRSFRWGAALAVMGPMGGGLALVAFAVGIAFDARQRVRSAAAALASQAVWIVPLLISSRTPTVGDYADSSSFATDAGGLLGLPRLLAGDGFWARSEQVGVHDGALVALIGVALFLLAIKGHRELPTTLRRPLASLAATGLVIAASSEIPGVRSVMSWLTGHEPFTALRESQRFLPLTLAWLAPAVALGGARLARDMPESVAAPRRVLPLALALVLAGPGLWGAGGRLVVVDTPADWKAARTAVTGAPGTVLVLPLEQHVDVALAGGRRLLNPFSELFDSDVLASSSLELAGPADPIDRRQAAAARALAAPAPISTGIEPLGVRWVAVLPGVDRSLEARVSTDPGLIAVVSGPNIQLYRAEAWVGAITTGTRSVDHRELIAPIWRVDASAAATWHRAGGWGWLRGTESATTDENGEVHLPSGSGLVWYWPVIPTVAAQLLTAAGVLLWRKPTVLGISDVEPLSSSSFSG